MKRPFLCRFGLHWMRWLPKGQTRQFKQCSRCGVFGLVHYL